MELFLIFIGFVFFVLAIACAYISLIKIILDKRNLVDENGKEK